ncbi:MAG: hypothetical protein JWR33_1866 [Naasia sp.]|jgi:NAD(P)-dependent dehydrogenase (short-subunit alcohol dehydrogenase family)|uniref:SDR family NAD(P)-dependent oxidoreductase n=1 Tax=Naasia sp. TaxID=2546198 RepID=UPI002638F692|nr:SDR family oxidoreductase [Naasia sp.]MCU1571125.1 hypothetical protein [Naasia sp.]
MPGAVVTGGSRGIGAAIVRALAKIDYRVLFTYSGDESGAAEVLATVPGSSALRVDGRQPDAAERLIDAAVETLATIDVLVNSAGIYPHADLRSLSREELMDVFRVNVHAPIELVQRVALPMAAAGGGAIVNITSVNAFAPESGMAAYDASKAALAQFTRTAALELGRHAIRVNAVAPGLVASPGIEEIVPERVDAFVRAAPLGRLVSPDEVAQAVVFLATPASSAITGQTLVVDAGVTLAGYMG